MKISTKGRYGLKAVVDIAHFGRDVRCVSLNAVSERQGISENYLEQIVAPLKKAGVLNSVRGAGGGYYLAKPPQDLTVGDVLRILEGSLAPADCVVSDDASCATGNCQTCSAKPVWETLFEGINQVVDSITIQDLIRKGFENDLS
ncbi:MAG: Rrf2 family transcriptional regulator [Defluviitaleaceae bacterium]|nr:Rrf2 family transcriptional regulator [Defluviitaleaceae bacterium]